MGDATEVSRLLDTATGIAGIGGLDIPGNHHEHRHQAPLRTRRRPRCPPAERTSGALPDDGFCFRVTTPPESVSIQPASPQTIDRDLLSSPRMTASAPLHPPTGRLHDTDSRSSVWTRSLGAHDVKNHHLSASTETFHSVAPADSTATVTCVMRGPPYRRLVSGLRRLPAWKLECPLPFDHGSCVDDAGPVSGQDAMVAPSGRVDQVGKANVTAPSDEDVEATPRERSARPKAPTSRASTYPSTSCVQTA
jgi:hypothetical protein